MVIVITKTGQFVGIFSSEEKALSVVTSLGIDCLSAEADSIVDGVQPSEEISESLEKCVLSGKVEQYVGEDGNFIYET